MKYANCNESSTKSGPHLYRQDLQNSSLLYVWMSRLSLRSFSSQISPICSPNHLNVKNIAPLVSSNSLSLTIITASSDQRAQTDIYFFLSLSIVTSKNGNMKAAISSSVPRKYQHGSRITFTGWKCFPCIQSNIQLDLKATASISSRGDSKRQ